MKTVFRVGMEVYDQVNNPNKKGKILDIKEDEICHKIHSYDYPIEVQFEGKDDLSYYDLEGCPVWSSNPTLSTSPYTLQGFEQKAPVPTFEEVIKDARSKGDYYYLHGLEAPSEELAEATMALLKLLFLRDYYNEGWQPDWKDDSIKNVNKYVMFVEKGIFVIRDVFFSSRVLAFKSRKIAIKFLEEQKELLEIAKPLL
jgi:hypothetical protein